MRIGRKQAEASTTARVDVKAMFTVPFSAPGICSPVEVEEHVAAQVRAMLAAAGDVALVFHIPEYTPPAPSDNQA